MNKPHLACDAALDKLKFPLIAMPKIDGVRGINFNGKMTGRSLKSHANKYVTAKYSLKEFAGFDGELIAGELTSPSLCRDTTSAVNRIEGTPEVKWMVFDWLHEGSIDMPYYSRLAALIHYVTGNELMQKNNIHVVPYSYVHSVEEVEALYQKYLDDGYEGLILRDPDGFHKDGRATVKTGAYLRLKPQSDKEAIVLSLVEAMENQNEAKVNELGRTERSSHKENKVGKGMVGMLVCKDLETGLTFNMGPGKMSHAERTAFWNHQHNLIGQYVKYRSMDVGVKDAPRFARFLSIRAKSDMS
jgi:DNA ligase-1